MSHGGGSIKAINKLTGRTIFEFTKPYSKKYQGEKNEDD